MSFDRLASILCERGDLLSRILLASAQVAAIAWFSPGQGLPLDDAWIHQVVGRTFAETGTLGYAPGQHGAAATSYLWAALLALGFLLRVAEPSRWALGLNGLAALATGQLLYALVRRARPERAAPATWTAISLAATLFATTSPNVLWFVCSGMEAMPFVALSLAAIWAATGESERRGRAALAGVLAGCLALLRPEAAPLGALLAAHALVRRRRRSVLPIALPWAACVAVYVGSNLVKTGHAAPSTLAGRRWLWFEMSSGLSRTERALEFLDAWTTRLGTYTFDTSAAVVWILAALAGYGALRLARRPGTSVASRSASEDAPALLFAWALFHAAFYALLLPTPGHGGRYQPLTPLLFAACLPIGGSLLLAELARAMGARRIGLGACAIAATAPFVALALPTADTLRRANALAVAHIEGTELAVGRFVDTLPEGEVASFDIGGSGFASHRLILDLGGLSDPATAALLESGRISTWLEARRVRWLVLPQSYEPALPTFADYRARLHLADNAAIALTPIRAFVTPFDKWEPSIRTTWNAAPKQVVYEVTYTSRPGPREGAPASARTLRPIADPEGLVPERERIVAEHMLATLAAWELPVELRLTSSAPAASASGDTGCALAIGAWGIAVDGCTSIGDPAILRASAYELAGRYLDVDDLGGALRAIPHAVARARRHVDPTFHPPLASLMLPVPGGTHTSATSATRWGLAVFAAAALGIAAIGAVARRRRERGAIVEAPHTLASAATLLVALLVALLAGCTGKADVRDAIRRGRGAVALAIAQGGDVDPAGRRAPILDAAWAGDAEIIDLLLAHGARVDVRDAPGASPLHLAARRGHGAAVAVLASAMRASAPASLDATAGPRRRTALHDAALAGALDAVEALLRAGASPNAADAFDQTPLHLAAGGPPARAAAIASALLAAGADPTLADRRGFTALHAAAAADEADVVRLLAAHATLIEARTPAGETALDLALRYARDRAAEALLAAGATLHAGQPPLHEAARMDAVERAAALVASGADVSRRFDGRTALDVAALHGSRRVEALLRETTR